MEKKSRKKIVLQNAKKWIIISIVFLVLLVGVGCHFLKNDVDYSVRSRTKILEKKQKNNVSSKKTVGWIRVQGTNIDYPVLYAPDYDFTFETEDFAWTEADFKELNNIVYISGHNIKNLSKKPLVGDKNHNRFEQLMGFAYYDFAKNNQFIQYTFNGEDYLYRIFAVVYFEGNSLNTYNTKAYSETEMKEFLKLVEENNLYKYDTDVNENDTIISLDTCTKMFGNSRDVHLTVIGRLLRDNEKAKMVNVQKTIEYDVIQNEMKGGDSDDEA